MPALSAQPLVEREVELERLAELIEAAGDGRGSLAVVEGPPGIGKTRLLEAACDLADQSLEVLRARASDLESQIPSGSPASSTNGDYAASARTVVRPYWTARRASPKRSSSTPAASIRRPASTPSFTASTG